MSWFGDEKTTESGGGSGGSIWDSISSSLPQAALSLVGGGLGTLGSLAAEAFGGGGENESKPQYHMGEEYGHDEGLWGMVTAADHDPLLAAQLNRGKDLHQQLGMAEPESMDEQLRRQARGDLKRRGGEVDRTEELRAAGRWKEKLRGIPGGSSY